MATNSIVISMRLPAASGARLKRLAGRHGWTPSDASARLVEEGLRRSEFAFIDFRDSSAGRQACLPAAESRKSIKANSDRRKPSSTSRALASLGVQPWR